MERMTMAHFNYLMRLPVSKPAIKGAAIMSAAKAYIMEPWMVDELRDQWAWTTPNTSFPLDRACPLSRKDFSDPRCVSCEIKFCPHNG